MSAVKSPNAHRRISSSPTAATCTRRHSVPVVCRGLRAKCCSARSALPGSGSKRRPCCPAIWRRPTRCSSRPPRGTCCPYSRSKISRSAAPATRVRLWPAHSRNTWGITWRPTRKSPCSLFALEGDGKRASLVDHRVVGRHGKQHRVGRRAAQVLHVERAFTVARVVRFREDLDLEVRRHPAFRYYGELAVIPHHADRIGSGAASAFGEDSFDALRAERLAREARLHRRAGRGRHWRRNHVAGPAATASARGCGHRNTAIDYGAGTASHGASPESGWARPRRG